MRIMSDKSITKEEVECAVSELEAKTKQKVDFLLGLTITSLVFSTIAFGTTFAFWFYH